MDPESNEPTQPEQSESEQARETTLNRNWLVKILIFLVVLLAFGIWGLYDALVVYPARGRAHAEWAELRYLEAAEQVGRLSSVSVSEPKESLATLREESDDLREQFEEAQARGRTGEQAEANLRLRRLDWLKALSLVGDLDEERTSFDTARERLEQLEQTWENRNPPKPLAFYDIPAQWVIAAVGFGGAAYLSVLLVRVGRKTFYYDPDTHTLTLPDGQTISPDEIEEVDKRKWDKFYVVLRFKGDRPPVRLDLLRYKHLEEWVLEMEKQTDSYEPSPDEVAAEERATPPTEPKQAGDLPPEPDEDYARREP